MNDTNNISNNNSTNKTRKPIGASTKNTYDGRLKSLAITDYINIDEVYKQIDKLENLGNRKASCNALIYYYNLQSTHVTNSDKILKIIT